MTPWTPTRIHRIIRKLETSAQTVIVETDSGEAYAKFPGSSEGEQFLALEVIGLEAARFLGLRTFDTTIVENPFPGLIEFADGVPSKAGPMFVLRSEKGTTWSGDSADLTGISNSDEVSGLLVLDTWVQNCDRYREHGLARENLGNVFLSREVKTRKRGSIELVAMDHTHIITCGSGLTKKIARIGQVKERRLYGNFPGFKKHISSADVYRYAKRLQEFQEEDAARIISKIPVDWLPAQEIQAALVEYLASRAGFVASNIGTMLADAGWIDWQLEL